MAAQDIAPACLAAIILYTLVNSLDLEVIRVEEGSIDKEASKEQLKHLSDCSTFVHPFSRELGLSQTTISHMISMAAAQEDQLQVTPYRLQYHRPSTAPEGTPRRITT